MSILKNLKKKGEKMDIRKGYEAISMINKLIEMKLLHVDLSTRKFSIEPVLWQGKDLLFKSHWCKSIRIYWDATTGNSSKDETFIVCDKNTGLEIGRFSEKGFTPN